MKRSSYYTLTRIAGIPYLLPFGQGIADHKHGVKINDTGAVLWNLLEKPSSEPELLAAFAKEYSLSEGEKASVAEDIVPFLTSLRQLGIIVPDNPFSSPAADEHYFSIAGISVKICGNRSFLSPELFSFSSSPAETVDFTITLSHGNEKVLSKQALILENRELIIYASADNYLIYFPSSVNIRYATLAKDGTVSTLYLSYTPTECREEEIFHTIRLLFLYRASLCHIYAIHSASILYRGKIFVFSAPSGTGKSTHTNLWKELFGVPVINGDLNLLAIDQNHAMVHGLPWCGTSEIYHTKSYPLGGIILLQQYQENEIVSLSPDEKALGILQRLISPAWNSSQLKQNLTFAEKLSSMVPVCRLRCTKDTKAAEVMKQYIDRQYTETSNSERTTS